MGNNVILLGVLEVGIKVHDRVEVLELQAVNQDSGLYRVDRVVLDPFLEVMDLHGFIKALDSKLEESGQLIVLLLQNSDKPIAVMNR